MPRHLKSPLVSAEHEFSRCRSRHPDGHSDVAHIPLRKTLGNGLRLQFQKDALRMVTHGV